MRALLGAVLGACLALAPADMSARRAVPSKEGLAAPRGYRLSAPGKAPVILPAELREGRELLPVKDAALLLGAAVTWKSTPRLLELRTADGRQLTLPLEEPWLLQGLSRTALPGRLSLGRGGPQLDKAALEALLKALVPEPPALVMARPGELQPSPTPQPPPTPSPEPTLEAPDEPRIVSGPSTRPNDGKLRLLVLDPGHGGRDPGAIGKSGHREKEACLDIVLRARATLRRLAPEIQVRVTRDNDRYLSLRQRTEFANDLDADLFVSVHNNASADRKGHGTQVFFYDSSSSDKAAADLAHRENADANYLEILMTDLSKSGPVKDQSIGLASHLQDSLSSALGTKERALSYAPFFVLARTKMPAVLIETAFITNPREEKLLASAQFRQKVADGIARGVLIYRSKLAHAR